MCQEKDGLRIQIQVIWQHWENSRKKNSFRNWTIIFAKCSKKDGKIHGCISVIYYNNHTQILTSKYCLWHYADTKRIALFFQTCKVKLFYTKRIALSVLQCFIKPIVSLSLHTRLLLCNRLHKHLPLHTFKSNTNKNHTNPWTLIQTIEV